MAPVQDKRLVFNSIPDGPVVAGETLKLETHDVDLDAAVLDGGIVIKTLVLSVDPYMRGRLRKPEGTSYVNAFELGKPLDGFAVGRVIRSEDPAYKVGDTLQGVLPFQEFVVIKGSELPRYKFANLSGKQELPLTYWVGTTGQLAKREGLRVIGSVGSDDKAEILMKEFGFDYVFNYKKKDTLEELQKFAPIQIYFDNVAGPTLDAFLQVADTFARIISCGQISQTNTKEVYGIKNLTRNMISKRITMRGFAVFDMGEEYEKRLYSEVPKWVVDGQLKVKEDVSVGMENAEKAFLSLFSGDNVGKAVIKVSD